MKKLLLSLALLIITSHTHAQTVDVKVHGMTCPFCVDAVQRKLSKLAGVKKVEVSLKLNLVRLHTGQQPVDLEQVRQTVVDSGFTPIEITPVQQ